MSSALLAACLWIVGASLTALLPLRQQVAPGLTLLIVAPVIVAWLSLAHGAWIAALAALAVAASFRRPLAHLVRRAGRRAG